MPLTTFWRAGLTAALAASALLLSAPAGGAAPADQAHAGSFCGEAPDPPADAPSTAIAATVGVPFSITLDSNPTTGYSWDLATPLDPNVVDLLQHTYQRAGAPRPLGAQRPERPAGRLRHLPPLARAAAGGATGPARPGRGPGSRRPAASA